MKRNVLLVVAAFAALLAIVFALGHNLRSTEAPEPMRIGEVRDIRTRDPITGRSYAEMLIAAIPAYEFVVEEITLAAALPPDYMLDADSVRIREHENADGLFINAYYTAARTNAEIFLEFRILETPEDAQESWMVSLASYATPFLPPIDPDIMVGAAAMGWPGHLNFVRGNIHVRIYGLSGNYVVEAARYVDAQIIRALEEAGG